MLAVISAALLIPSLTFSTTLTVEQDGSGSYTSVAAAIDASTSGDSILVGPGHYHEPRRVVAHTIALLSTDGESATTIDGDDDHQILQFEYTSGVVVDGFRFIRSYNTVNRSVVAFIYGATGTVRSCTFENNANNPITSWTGAAVTVEDCTFSGNATDSRAGAVYVSITSSATITDSEFIGNSVGLDGGAVSAVSGSHLTITRCEFRNNSAAQKGGAIHAGINVTANITDCLFVSNAALTGSAILAHKSSLTVRNSTFDDNTADLHEGSCVGVQYGFYTFERNIISNDTGYAALMPDLSAGTHGCNIFYNVSGVEIHDEALDPTDRSVWPGYCDIAAGDYSVGGDGPAAPAGNACAQLIGAFAVGCPVSPPPPEEPPPVDPDVPVIMSILDVPNDQGRHVRIKWNASAQDDGSAYPQVMSYGIYRYDGMIATTAAAAVAAGTRDAAGAVIESWDYLMSVPARGDAIYQTVVKTTCDSTVAAGLCQTAFFVSAETAYPTVFWDSAPDTGYSVDNLPPEVPQTLMVQVGTDGLNRLSWPESDAPDVDAYHVYRGRDVGFGLDVNNRVAVVDGVTWQDPSRGTYVYKLTAVDKAGNESEPVSASAAPATFSLGQNIPNPFNPATVIPYTVPVSGGQVTLRIYDVAGRLVRTLLDGIETPGARTAEWNGRDDRGARVSSGVYFYRFSAPGFEATRKMVLVQ